MSQNNVASSQSMPRMGSFIKQTAGVSAIALAFLLLGVAILLTALLLGRYSHRLQSMLSYFAIYLPVLSVTVSFAWLRSFHPNLIPAALPVDSSRHRKLRRIAFICFISALGFAVTLLGILMLGCLCRNEWLAAHAGSLLNVAQIFIYGTAGASLGMVQYLRERREKPAILPDVEGNRLHGPHLELYGLSGPNEVKPFQSEHWGER